MLLALMLQAAPPMAIGGCTPMLGCRHAAGLTRGGICPGAAWIAVQPGDQADVMFWPDAIEYRIKIADGRLLSISTGAPDFGRNGLGAVLLMRDGQAVHRDPRRPAVYHGDGWTFTGSALSGGPDDVETFSRVRFGNAAGQLCSLARPSAAR